jgi:uncharacterized membrane protein YraQ (UPF0718 family)
MDWVTRMDHELLDALRMAFIMFWDIFWGLSLGFLLSAVVEAVVSKSEITRLLPDNSPKSIGMASLLGAASSSCSYAAVALARSIFRKGGDFTAAMTFQIASTNLVAELGILLAVLIGWQFTVAEFFGGPLMIVLLVLLFRALLRPGLVRRARKQAEKGLRGKMEGHAEMDMAVTEGPLLRRIFSPRGRTAVSHHFLANWVMLWKDLAGGLLIAGALAAWVPKSFWSAFFLSSHPLLAKFWGPVVGPIVAILSFVCSVGNVPLAAVLWNTGSSFGGVIAFIFADLLVIPILDIYRKYYGRKMALFLLGTMYAAIVVGALVVEFVFGAVGWVPTVRQATVSELAITWNYTTVLNLVFFAIGALVVIRSLRAGGKAMLAME